MMNNEGWIMIEDGAPSEDEDVIITDGEKVGEGRVCKVSEVGAAPGFPLGAWMGMFSRSDSWGECRCKVVAWQPMPKPPVK